MASNRLVVIRIVTLVLFLITLINSDTAAQDRAKIRFVDRDFAIADLDHRAWKRADAVRVRRHWSGAEAAQERGMNVRLIWSDNSLYARFEAEQREALVVSYAPTLDTKTLNLWDRDVVEIFVAPDANEPRRYFEFEVAPTGEWIDLALDLTSGKRVTGWDYKSGMESAARIEKDRVVVAMKIPWNAFGRKPKAGDVWLGNIFRCVGAGETRGYLAWQPTMTAEANFHVPEKFGQLVFVR